MKIRVLESIPTAGEFEEINFDIDDTWKRSNWNYAHFTTTDFQEWVGAFREKDNSNFIVAELDNGLACIVSGGHGYIIDIDKKQRIKDLETETIIDLFADNVAGSFILSRWWDIVIVDRELNEIRIDPPIDTDGIYFKEIIGRNLNLEIEEIGSDMTRTRNYYLDLDKRRVEKHVP